MKARVLLWLAQRWLRMGDHLLDLDMTKWHTYSLHWRREAALFDP